MNTKTVISYVRSSWYTLYSFRLVKYKNLLTDIISLRFTIIILVFCFLNILYSERRKEECTKWFYNDMIIFYVIATFFGCKSGSKVLFIPSLDQTYFYLLSTLKFKQAVFF